MKKKILYILVIQLFSVYCYSQYVELVNDKFKLNGQDFYPIVMNYAIEIRHYEGTDYLIPHPSYCRDGFCAEWYDSDPTNDDECTWQWGCCRPDDPQPCLDKIHTDLQNIADWGFNTIRLVGLSNEDEQNHIDMVKQVLDIIESYGLKVIYLTGGDDENPNDCANHLNYMANELKDYSTIMAFDIYNEPEYHDTGSYTKYETCSMINQWYNSIKSASTNHLVTIGLGSNVSTFEWDPHFMTVDFLSFHPYGGETRNVYNSQVMWYSLCLDKPWIIGETGLPGTDDANDPCFGTVSSEAEQSEYAEETLNRCFDCGGIGYSWWQYQDVKWAFQGALDCGNNTLGLITRDQDGHNLNGNVKDVITDRVFQDYVYSSNSSNCYINSNLYRNPHNYNGYHCSGRVTDSANNPIENAIIWAKYGNSFSWSVSYSRHDGSYDIYSPHNDSVIKMISISYPGYSVYDSPWYSSGVPSIINGLIGKITYDDNESYTGTIANGQYKTIKATNSISISNTTVNSGGHLTLLAENNISFNDGFNAHQGSYVTIGSGIFSKCDAIPSGLRSAKVSLPQTSFTETTPEQQLNNELNQNYSLNIYPNPSKGIINVLSNQEIDKLVVYNQNGQQVVSLIGFTSNMEVNLTNQPKGMYFIVAFTKETIYRDIIILK